VLAMACGLRQGELLGLRWVDVDLEGRSLRVRAALQWRGGAPVLVEPKSERARRVVSLPDLVVGVLRTHRVRQIEDRLLAGARWQTESWGLVFTSTVGTPLDAVGTTRRFQRLLLEAGLPPSGSTICGTRQQATCLPEGYRCAS